MTWEDQWPKQHTRLYLEKKYILEPLDQTENQFSPSFNRQLVRIPNSGERTTIDWTLYLT